MIKIKVHKDCNYKSVFNTKTGHTIRFALNPNKPILPLQYPEILDIGFNTLCYAQCSFCYTNAVKDGINFSNIVEKINNWFGSMSENDRPRQVAIGGSGEATLHPEFCEALKAFYDLGIMPNYTTNAMHLNDKIIDYTKKYCGGVAISTHPHLEKIWKKGIKTLVDAKIRTNLHIIIGQEGSVKQFYDTFEQYKDVVEYFVALPYNATGRAKEINVIDEWDEFFNRLKDIDSSKVAFGALFYPYLLANKEKLDWLKMSIYEPECMSGYVMFNTDELVIRKSSYDLRPKFEQTDYRKISLL